MIANGPWERGLEQTYAYISQAFDLGCLGDRQRQLGAYSFRGNGLL